MEYHDFKPALRDDGTLDTVIECVQCNRQYRYNYDNGDTFATDYNGFVAWAIEDAQEYHADDLYGESEV